jgi:hypothetical protein
MKSRSPLVLPLSAAVLLLAGCAVGRHHTPDAQLQRFFWQHQADFEQLLREVQADSQLMTVQPGRVIYPNGGAEVGDTDFVSELVHIGLSSDRWGWYQQRLQHLGLAGGVLKGDDGQVEFRVDPGSLSNGDSYKGYWYSSIQPGPILPNLDAYRISDRERSPRGWFVCKPLKANWYLYLFVNR